MNLVIDKLRKDNWKNINILYIKINNINIFYIENIYVFNNKSFWSDVDKT